MTTLADIFAELGISHYLNDFVDQGFDTWETILDIQESDFDALNVKLGHRRKIQRRIANSRGLSSDRALGSPNQAAQDDRLAEEQTRAENKDGVSGVFNQGAKRKYRRHPKADENAPERPPSAYVIFSNKMREDLKGRNLSFTEIAKLVGENWQNLLPQDKEPYEKHAAAAKEKFASEMAEYKKTEQYREYSQYLADFKARQSNQQPVNDTEPSKRPKLDVHPSTGSTGTTSSGADTPSSSRADSSNSQWPSNNERRPPSPSLASSSKSNVGQGFRSAESEPSRLASPTILPGYRESIFGANHPSLPWRDGSRDDGAATLQQFSQANVNLRRSSHSGTSLPESRNLPGPVHHSPHPPPPLLSSESTNSTVSSVYFSPHTPMEPPLERSSALPSIFSQKPGGGFENQLPPLRQPSLSPQTNISGHLPSPSGIHPGMDFPHHATTLHGYRGHSAPQHPQNDARQHEYTGSQPGDDNLDPVSALLKAGEIVNRNSRHYQ